jgi:hypothetical protein
MYSCTSNPETKNSETTLDPSLIENPATASADSTSKKSAPVLKFDSDTHDFGTIVQGEVVSFAFKFKNVGNADLIIRAAQGSCGCTVPEFPKEPVKPGSSGIINIAFNSEGKEGSQHKTVTVISNTIPNTYTLNVIGNVKVDE